MKTLKHSKINDIKENELKQTSNKVEFARLFKDMLKGENKESLLTKLKEKGKKAMITLIAVSMLYTTNINCGESVPQPPVVEDAAIAKDASPKEDATAPDDVSDAGKDVLEDAKGDVDVDSGVGDDTATDAKEDVNDDSGIDAGEQVDDVGLDADDTIDVNWPDAGVDAQDVPDTGDTGEVTDVCTPGEWETKAEDKSRDDIFISKEGTSIGVNTTFNVEYETNGCEINNEHITRIIYKFSPSINLDKMSLSQVQLGLCTTIDNCDLLELEYPGETSAIKLAQTYGFGLEKEIIFGIKRIVDKSNEFTGCHPISPKCYTMKETNGTTERDVQVCCFGNGQQPIDLYYNKVRYSVATTTGATCLSADDRCLELLTFTPNEDISKIKYR
ncbi:MAG: hypothetical protein QW500_03720, partial [Candidatus Micrarchaeia archaeon]